MKLEKTKEELMQMCKDIAENPSQGKCWCCGEPAKHKIRMQLGFSPGPYRYSPWIEYCYQCGREMTNWFGVTYKDMKQVWYGKANRKWREKHGVQG